MSTIAETLTIILTGLRAVIAEHTVIGRPRTPMFTLLWGRVGRIAQRFEALFARWRAGTLPKPRPSRAGQARTRPEQPSILPRIPRGRTWLVALLGYQAAGRGSQLQHLLAQPDMAEFLQAVPQATRMLRPLCHMLGLPPAALPSRATPPPPRPATARPSNPRAAQPPATPPTRRQPKSPPSPHFSPA